MAAINQIYFASDTKFYTLIDKNGKSYKSPIKGTLGGHCQKKIYGKLDCPSALRWIAKGYYKEHRVFFKDERTAILAGYRPCGVCMKPEYKEWKKDPEVFRRKKLDIKG